ncbi:Amuc_1100 family pilus-like protein [Lentisphaera profundi]|uniref:Amuc_1100 family pilus-like protein n=1 Tax=Lentisphaera profundi TaxID=1658616 RepID=A0ABY7VTE0_9BACT|nr:Amuc_1100 family pilus-like protein [Lentisphaera profundi]WDE96024.1 Amuc_1100 family pilus-like protein [Lentisphaera profundi]
MKDKILEIIKDNKANVALLVSVFVVSTVLFKLSFVYKSETAKLQEEKARLGNDTQQINSTKYKLDDLNRKLSQDNIASLKSGFNDYYSSLIEDYNHDASAVAEMRSEDVQDKFLESIESLRKICESAEIVVTDEFNFSFDDEVSRVFKMEARDKVKVMEQLVAIENLVKIIASSGVVEISSVSRPNQLEETQMGEAYAKVYTFVLVLKVKPEGFGTVLNKITNDKQFYYRINSVSMVTAAQVDKDLVPLMLKEAAPIKSPDEDKVTSVDDLLNQVEGEALLSEEVEVEVEPEERVNIRAFEAPEQTMKISLDWIQFKASYLEQ